MTRVTTLVILIFSCTFIFCKILQPIDENDVKHYQPCNVKFESLIAKKETGANTSVYMTNNGQKNNFKKFVKIPKATQSQPSASIQHKNNRSSQPRSYINNKSKLADKSVINKTVGMFKSFKNEPFDVDSQFQMFLNSQR